MSNVVKIVLIVNFQDGMMMNRDLKISLKELKENVDEHFFNDQPECSMQEDYINPYAQEFQTALSKAMKEEVEDEYRNLLTQEKEEDDRT
jgi:6-pyruvoyl-tetrahydropterin synthase